VQVAVALEEEAPLEIAAARRQHLAQRPLLQYHLVGATCCLHRRLPAVHSSVYLSRKHTLFALEESEPPQMTYTCES
jgi:hypothetical protein